MDVIVRVPDDLTERLAGAGSDLEALPWPRVASGKIEAEGRIDVNDVASAVTSMASLPLEVHVQHFH